MKHILLWVLFCHRTSVFRSDAMPSYGAYASLCGKSVYNIY